MEEVNASNVYKALFEIQGKIPVIPFDAEVNYGKTRFKYATLGKIMEEIKPYLQEVGLVIMYTVDKRAVKVSLIHAKSETRVDSSYDLPELKSAQELGSWLTYVKRYLISGLLGIVTDEDTDGPRPNDPGRRENPARVKKTNVKRKKKIETEEEIQKAVKYIQGGGSWKVILDNYDMTPEVHNRIDELLDEPS